MTQPSDLLQTTLDQARPFESRHDLAPLIQKISGSRIVMLGEASHGTREFYEWRTEISKELIENHGYHFIAVEGDWPPCQRVNQYLRSGDFTSGTARDALDEFRRWPTWMWANEEVKKLVDWLHRRNTRVSRNDRTGFYGLDVYSLFESIDTTLELLEKINPFLAKKVRHHYSCFDHYDRDEREYAKSLIEFPAGCEDEVMQTLTDLLKTRLNGTEDREEILFDARQNARIVKNAEDYYRTMIQGNEDSWNVRDRHMMETLTLLLDHYGPHSKGIVWEHNTHIGDYRATPMARLGQINIGGLARQDYGESQVSLVGFGTYQGSVIASHAWEGPTETLSVPPAKPGSYEAIFHSACQNLQVNQFFLLLDQENEFQTAFTEVKGHRAIGVVYDPDHERTGNYVPTSLSKRYDAFIFIDQTQALRPFGVEFDEEKLPEAWPSGQ